MLALAGCVGGATANSFGKRISYWLWLFGNIFWVAYAAITKQYVLMAQYIVFLGITVNGLYWWYKKEIGS